MANSQPKSTGLVWVLTATRRSVCIHQMNRVNSVSDISHDDIPVNIVVVIIIIIVVGIMHSVAWRHTSGRASTTCSSGVRSSSTSW